jgi:pyruvyltransferase
MSELAAEVELFHWNPRRPRFRGPIGRRIPLTSPVNNFGDLLGPMVVKRVLEQTGIDAQRAVGPARLLSIGSVLRSAQDGDVIWGTGVNGKSLQAEHRYRRLDVRAVRGPLTREFLLKRGIDVPEVLGDPGLLLGTLWQRAALAEGHDSARVLVVPNLHDYPAMSRAARRIPGARVLNPRDRLEVCIGRIAASEYVIGSSLHGIVLADSFGVPARLVRSSTEHPFKYEDYYLGSGRSSFTPAKDLREALDLGPEQPPTWSAKPLLESFPYDLWRTAPAADRNIR